MLDNVVLFRSRERERERKKRKKCKELWHRKKVMGKISIIDSNMPPLDSPNLPLLCQEKFHSVHSVCMQH